MMRLRVTVFGLLMVGSILAPAAPASADTAQVISAAATFVAPVAVMQPGDTLVLNNQDVLPHNLVSTDGLFETATISMGETSVAEGAESLEPGQYQFLCTLHPWMVGALVVQNEIDQPILPPTDGGGEPPAVPGVPATVSGVVPTPTSVTEHDGHLYVTSYVLGALYKLKVGAGGILEPGTLVADGFTNPLGVVVGDDGTAYVSDSHPSDNPERTTEGRVWAVQGADKEIVIDGLPNGRHNTNGMAINGKRLYITNGNSTDDGASGGEPEVPPYSGSLLSVPLKARNLGPADSKVEATGMRNVYDVAFRPGTNEAWMPSNGPDALEPYGEDLLHKAVVKGRAPDFGFPGCIYREGPDGPTDPEVADNPVIEGGCGAHTPPEVTLGLHVSADGLAFGPAGTPWDGSVFIAEFGNFFGPPAGRKIVRVPIDDNGVASAPVDVFVGAGPLDLTFANGNLYVADFAASQIVLVTPEMALG